MPSDRPNPEQDDKVRAAAGRKANWIFLCIMLVFGGVMGGFAQVITSHLIESGLIEPLPQPVETGLICAALVATVVFVSTGKREFLSSRK